MEQLLVTGITVGCIYAIIALSFTPAYSSSNVVNFAQGELVMLGTLMGATFAGSMGWPYVGVVVPTMIAVAAVNVVIYVGVVRPMRKRGAGLITMILGTLAAGVLLRVGASFLWGLEARRVPAPFGGNPVRVGSFVIPPQSIVIVVGVLAVLFVAWLIYEKTLVGLKIRATSLRRNVAQLVGINVETLTVLTFAMSGALAGLAGVLYGPVANVAPWTGLQYALWGFVALIIGGLGSWTGPVIAGIALGILEAFARAELGTGYGESVTLLLLLAVLYLRPTGLLGAPDLVDHTA